MAQRNDRPAGAIRRTEFGLQVRLPYSSFPAIWFGELPNCNGRVPERADGTTGFSITCEGSLLLTGSFCENDRQLGSYRESMSAIACFQRLRRITLSNQLSVGFGSEDVTIFKEMRETRVIDPGWDYHELLRMLSEAIARGYVDQVPVMKPHRYAPPQNSH